MKTLKRTLSLVLVLVMVAGLLSVGAQAAFTDEDQIEYKEAVGVMSGMGIIKGRDTGAFDPKATLNRAEVATMIYKAATGDVDAKQVGLYASSNQFKDVPTTDWYAGYVGYADYNKIVVGDGDGNFRPGANVTGYEALVMVLRTLGYDSEAGGREITNAPNWQAAALNRAAGLGITVNVSSVQLGEAITREVAAEILYRAFLQSNVQYSKDKEGYEEITTGNNATIFTKFHYTKTQADDASKPAAVDTVTAVAEAAAGTPNAGKLVTTTTGGASFVVDSYAVAGHQFRLYKDSNNNVLFAEQVTTTEIVADKTDAKYDKYTVDANAFVYNNYEKSGTQVTGAVKNNANIANGDTLILNGTKVINVQHTTKTMEVVTVATSVKGVKTATATISGAKKFYDSSVTDGTGITKSFGVNWAALEDGKYYVTSVAVAGTYNFTPVETIEGVITVKNETSSKITVNGVVYDYETSGASNTTLTPFAPGAVNFKDTYTFYISGITGKIFAAVKVPGSSTVDGSLAYVVNATIIDGEKDQFGNPAKTLRVQAVYEDGTVALRDIVAIGNETVIFDGTAEPGKTIKVTDPDTIDGSFYYVAETTNGYVLNSAASAKTAGAADKLAGTDTETELNAAYITLVGDATPYYITSTSKFIYVDNNVDITDGDSDVGAGELYSKLATHVETGRHNSKSLNDSVNYDIFFVYTETSGTRYIETAYVMAKYVAPTNATTSTDLYVVASYDGQSGAGQYVYTVYQLGASTSVQMTLSAQLDLSAHPAFTALYTVKATTDAEGKTTYTMDYASTETGAQVVADTLLTSAPVVVDGKYTIGQNTVAEDCVFVNTSADKTVTAINQLETGDTITTIKRGGNDNATKNDIVIVVLTTKGTGVLPQAAPKSIKIVGAGGTPAAEIPDKADVIASGMLDLTKIGTSAAIDLNNFDAASSQIKLTVTQADTSSQTLTYKLDDGAEQPLTSGTEETIALTGKTGSVTLTIKVAEANKAPVTYTITITLKAQTVAPKSIVVGATGGTSAATTGTVADLESFTATDTITGFVAGTTKITITPTTSDRATQTFKVQVADGQAQTAASGSAYEIDTTGMSGSVVVKVFVSEANKSDRVYTLTLTLAA